MPVTQPEASAAPSSLHDASEVTADVDVSDPGLLLELTGPSAVKLARLEQACGALSAGLRGTTIRLRGSRESVSLAERALTEMMEVIQSGGSLRDQDIASAVRLLAEHPEIKLRDIYKDVAITAAS
ncbi:MAG TPA: hypothetical protein VJR89_26100, partial [Polyangiales bacterium]|nr:hypothetical protein [Polyangiales bacterium]